MDRTTQEDIKAHLMQTSEQYRDLLNQHHHYDRLVAELEEKHTLTPEEELEEHRLKKLKLRLKDQMEQMVSDCSLQHAAG
jgi:uncharacterized protein YdcH (DUF465 family)